MGCGNKSGTLSESYTRCVNMKFRMWINVCLEAFEQQMLEICGFSCVRPASFTWNGVARSLVLVLWARMWQPAFQRSYVHAMQCLGSNVAQEERYARQITRRCQAVLRSHDFQTDMPRYFLSLGLISRSFT
mmetsp:Transcript_26631/g.60062  ORF Transcript_26631/g.60062 Transcript_26631/m.60062 type:complete len:131 (-) Transcript_26631:19-411(-)